MSSPDPEAKLKSAAVLIKKYPKTVIRPRVAQGMADEVANVKDNSQKLTLAQELQTTFNEPSEAQLIGPVVVQAYADAGQPDEAFAKGAQFLTQTPDALRLLVQLVAIGTDQVKKRNPKLISQTIDYGDNAVALIEADKKPTNFDDARWKSYKSETLPGLYQSLGLLHFSKGDRGTALAKFRKSAELAPSEAFNFVMIGALLNDEYQTAAKNYQSIPAGKARDDELKRVEALLDSVIDAYAHAIAVSEGNTSLQQVRQQYQQDLENYYRYRHHGSTEGMQQMIDKYKAPAKP